MPLLPGSVLAALYCPRIHAEAVFLLVIQTVQRPREKGPDQAPSKAALPPSLMLPGPVPVLWGQRKEKPDSQLEPVGKSLGFGRRPRGLHVPGVLGPAGRTPASGAGGREEHRLRGRAELS